jgi:hypothetical protein
LPKTISADDELKLWLKLFDAETEEELKQIKALGVQVMEEPIEAYRHVSATDEFKEIERLRSRARHNEASALGNARREGAEQERVKWVGVVAEQAERIAELEALLDKNK